MRLARTGIVLIVWFWVLSPMTAQASPGLTVTPLDGDTLMPEDLVDILAGPGVTDIANVSYSSSEALQAAGTFSEDAQVVGLDDRAVRAQEQEEGGAQEGIRGQEEDVRDGRKRIGFGPEKAGEGLAQLPRDRGLQHPTEDVAQPVRVLQAAVHTLGSTPCRVRFDAQARVEDLLDVRPRDRGERRAAVS